MSKRDDLREIAERFYPRRNYWGGFTAPEKEYPMDPLEAQAIKQEAADKAANDKLEALVAKPLSDEQQYMLEIGDNVTEEWAKHKGYIPPRSLARPRSSAEVSADAARNGWSAQARREYLDAIGREDVARKASRTYRGAA